MEGFLEEVSLKGRRRGLARKEEQGIGTVNRGLEKGTRGHPGPDKEGLQLPGARGC